jgi:hypothetical protein
MHMHGSTHCGWWQAGTTKDAVQPCQYSEPFLTTSDSSNSLQQPSNDWLGTRHLIVRGRILVNLILAVVRGKRG